MIVGMGTDIVELSRIEEIYTRLSDRFAARILTPLELETFNTCANKAAFLAKRFCIKEAAAKALGTGIGRGISWQHMWLEHNDDGAPFLKFSEGAADRLASLGGDRIHVSVSDERSYATATVILESA